MATAYVSIGKVGARTENGIVQTFLGNECASEVITTSATSAAGSLVATKNAVAQVVCSSPVYAMSAASPVATSTNGVYVPANIPSYLILSEGHSVALIDA